MDAKIKTLYELSVFNKKTFFDTITDNDGVLSKSTLEKYLKKYLESGEIVRIGRNAYCVRGKLKDYEYDYSGIAVHIAKILNEDFYDLDFRISELYQMNRFLNHQIAHNVIFVFVENLSLTCMYKVIYYKQVYNKLIYSIGDLICQVVPK